MPHVLKKSNKLADKLRELGNESYSKGEIFDSLLKFNESLCFAEVGTLSVGLAYANRSAAYLRLRRYENCLRNIKLARDCGYPEEKLIKLRQREQKCIEGIELEGNERNDTPWNFFKLSYEPNEKIPFLSSCLELRDDDNFGPHFITTRDVKSGDFLAVVEGALKFIDPLARFHRCSWCVGDNLLDLIPCTGCPKAMFCSDECMRKGKLDFHYKHCKLNPFAQISALSQELVPGDQEQLETLVVERAYARLSAMFNGNVADCAEFLDSKKGKTGAFMISTGVKWIKTQSRGT